MSCPEQLISSSAVPSHENAKMMFSNESQYRKNEDEIERLKSEIDFLQDMLNQLLFKERKMTKEITEIEDKLKQLWLQRTYWAKIFHVQCVGLLDNAIIKNAQLTETDVSLIVTLLSSDWQPYKTVYPNTKRPSKVLNHDDEKLKMIESRYGKEVSEEVIRVFNQIEAFNPNQRFPKLMPWNKDKQAPYTTSEKVSILVESANSLLSSDSSTPYAFLKRFDLVYSILGIFGMAVIVFHVSRWMKK